MRKTFLVATAISLFMALGASPALATGGDDGKGKGSGKPCPPASPGGQEKPPDSAPNCGKGNGGKPGHGGGAPPGARICSKDDLTLLEDIGLLEGRPLVCLYFPGNEGDPEADCPDNFLLLEAPEDTPLEGGAICVLPGTGGGGLPLGGGDGLPALGLPARS